MVVAQVAERARAGTTIKGEGTGRRVVGKSGGGEVVVVATMGVLLVLGGVGGVEDGGGDGVRHTAGDKSGGRGMVRDKIMGL